MYNDTIFTWLSLSAGRGRLFGIKGLHADKKYSYDPNEGNLKFSRFAFTVINGKFPIVVHFMVKAPIPRFWAIVSLLCLPIPGESEKNFTRFAGYGLKSIRPIFKTKLLIYRVSQKNARYLKKSCSLNIKAMILKSVLFYSLYVKFVSVIYPALIGHSFLSK